MNFQSPRVRLPWLTLALGLATLGAWHIPGINEALSLDRDAVNSGAWWRLLTGHFVHWTASHLTWDLLAFLGLGALVEWRSRRTFVLVLISSAVAISAAVWFLAPQLTSYRGLSGIDTALFAAAVTTAAANAIRERAWFAALVPTLALGGFLAKSLGEWLGHGSVFVAASATFVPVPLAHLTGAIAGAVVALAFTPSTHHHVPPRSSRRESGFFSSRNRVTASQSSGA